MPPKKDEKKDEILDSIALLTATVTSLKDKIEQSTTDDELKKLTVSIANLTNNVDDQGKKNGEKFDELNESIAHIKDTMLQNVIKTNNELSEKLSVMEKRIIDLERIVNVSGQRSRENNIEFQGIDDSIPNTNLQTSVVKIFGLLNIEIFD